jgi:hypothetical protein
MSPFVIPIVIFLIPITAIVGGVLFLIVRTVSRSRVRELEIRERIAMIERGLVPAPEADPRGFERAMARHETVIMRKSPSRFRGAGIIIMGSGLALLVLIGFAGGEPGAAIGVGGAIVVLGLAFFINSLFDTGRDLPPLPPLPRSPIAPPPPPPAIATPPAPPEQRTD